MILKFKSNKFFDERSTDAVSEPKLVWPGSGFDWVSDIERIQEIEYIDLPGWDNAESSDDAIIPGSYLNPNDHFARCYFVGLNPRDFNANTNEQTMREHQGYNMCYVYRKGGKIDLLAIGFLAEVYILNDEGKTIDQLYNKAW